MNTNITGFRCFSKNLCALEESIASALDGSQKCLRPCALDESSLSIGRVYINVKKANLIMMSCLFSPLLRKEF